MARVIKFRAWDGEKMISPDYLDRNGVAHWFEDSIPTICDTVMQFTGLRDKNGKEIYEGDIVSVKGDTPMVINWNKKLASFCLDKNGWAFSHFFWEVCHPESCEIIGNRYENPDLLTSK